MSKEKIAAWITELIGELTSIAKPSVKAGQESYMKHVVKYRGVKNPQVRSIAASLIKKHKLTGWLEPDIYQLSFNLLKSEYFEEKLSGIVILSQKTLPLENWQQQLNLVLEAFQRGDIADWATCDCLCGGVLDKVVRSYGQHCAEEIASWCQLPAAKLWTKRASAVSFVKLAPKCKSEYPWLLPILLKVCNENVVSKERFLQTATGWLIRQISVGLPKEALQFVESNLKHFSREGLRYALEKTPSTTAKKFMNKHKVLLSKH